MDAVEDLRCFLEAAGVHDYSKQPKGIASKVMRTAFVLTPRDSFVRADASLYRPETKNGDPRIWFSRLGGHASPSDILAISVFRGELFIFNLTKVDLVAMEARGGDFGTFLAPFFVNRTSIVDELRGLLEFISAQGFIRSEGSADNTIGMILERELGIEPNSSRAPDFKGIEIKASRANRGSRHNLFARVPDWSISNLKSSQAILDSFGYEKEGRRQLYCTVSHERPNPQGLYLYHDDTNGVLWERSTRDDLRDVVAWPGHGLEKSLVEKHTETFWVAAESRMHGNDEEFHFIGVEHTSNPIVEQLIPLIKARHVNLDHLNREKNGRAAERGPLFKLRHGGLSLLFPPSKLYKLTPTD
ncbi:MAG: MvaI/BcnI family restriction endonuclease [Rhodoglobus sp.]